MSDSLQPHRLQHARLSCPSVFPRVCSISYSLSQWCNLTISSFVAPFSFCLQSFPASGYFPLSQLFTTGGQSIATLASTSVLPKNIQSWFPLGLTDLISLLSKGFSRVFSSAQLKNISSLVLSLLYGSTLTPVHGYWKEHSFNYIYLCWQSDVSAF